MLTNKDIYDTALRQSALDYGCLPEDFLKKENTVTISKDSGKQRVYLKLPLACSMVTYGNGIVAQASNEAYDIVKDYINSYPREHCFETPHLHVIDGALSKIGYKICFMAEYFLPDVQKITRLECDYATKVLYPRDFEKLYTDEWSNALCEKRKHLDMIAVGAYDGDRLIGLAGASADCDTMWQIGIDVLPEYRQKGIASALTSQLTFEVIERGKVPFYCAAWCNIKSVRNAIKCGYRPAWTEVSAKSIEYVNEMNKTK